MNDFDIWLGRAVAVLGLAVTVSKETRAWLEYKKKRKPNSHKKKR